jgi:hypothetical protein
MILCEGSLEGEAGNGDLHDCTTHATP